MDVDDIDSTQQPATAVTTGTITAVTRGGFGRQQWPHSSRIIRVSRASGGKDRHSKVWTAKGPRDRRVRLSVNTAIQFYDLQDRLGYDQPSKAVEWLIKAAAEAINELPCLDSSNFPTSTDMVITRAGADNCMDDGDQQQQQQQLQKQRQVGSMSKSGCSSNNSDTSKGSGLSLSRSEIRVKARERARERTTAKEKEENSPQPQSQPQPQPPPPSSRVSIASIGSGQSSSFTQLLTAGIDKASSTTTTSYHNGGSNNNNNPMVADYFGSGFMSLSANRFGNAPLPHVMSLLPFSGSHEIQLQNQHHHQHQHQHQHQQSSTSSFLADHQNQNNPLVHQVPNTTTTSTSTGGGVSNDYNLNFSISSSSNNNNNGFNRGTLQSNSTSTSSPPPPPSFLSYLSGSSVPFFLGGAPISPVVVENQQHHHVHHYHHDHNHHQFNPAEFELQLRYGDGAVGRHSDHKGKGKN